MRYLMPYPFLTLAFAVLWIVLVNDWAVAQVLLGGLVGWLIPLGMQSFWRPRVRVRHPLRLLGFLVRVQFDILTANFTVARLILGPTRRVRPAFVEVPLDVEQDFLITVLASVVSLTPGTVAADVSPDRRRLLVHTLDVREPEALASEIKKRYERPIMEIFQC